MRTAIGNLVNVVSMGCVVAAIGTNVVLGQDDSIDTIKMPVVSEEGCGCHCRQQRKGDRLSPGWPHRAVGAWKTPMCQESLETQRSSITESRFDPFEPLAHALDQNIVEGTRALAPLIHTLRVQ